MAVPGLNEIWDYGIVFDNDVTQVVLRKALSKYSLMSDITALNFKIGLHNIFISTKSSKGQAKFILRKYK